MRQLNNSIVIFFSSRIQVAKGDPITTASFVRESDLYTAVKNGKFSKGVEVKDKKINGNQVWQSLGEAPRALQFKSDDLLDNSKYIYKRERLVHQTFKLEGVLKGGVKQLPNHWEGNLEPQKDAYKINWWDEDDKEKAPKAPVPQATDFVDIGTPGLSKAEQKRRLCQNKNPSSGSGSRNECKPCKACAIAR